jgi:hypothetical protein
VLSPKQLWARFMDPLNTEIFSIALPVSVDLAAGNIRHADTGSARTLQTPQILLLTHVPDALTVTPCAHDATRVVCVQLGHLQSAHAASSNEVWRSCLLHPCGTAKQADCGVSCCCRCWRHWQLTLLLVWWTQHTLAD